MIGIRTLYLMLKFTSIVIVKELKISFKNVNPTDGNTVFTNFSLI